MKFTPFGIKNQDFNKAVRGYDKEEVRAFLERLSDEVERISNENEKLKTDFDSMEDQLKEFRRIEKNLQNALLSATETTTKAVDSAKKQSALMIKEAELKSQQIVEKAKENANDTLNSVLKLKEEKRVLIAKLKAIINSQAELLDWNVSNYTESKEKKNLEVKTERKNDISEENEVNVNDILGKLL
ncbi:MAG: DivIVA domain-containing protein [Melioribacteraceae bacterium]|nr:DivIVA domain-containing protein [Melioribacteraceae bacterium]